MVSFLQEYFNSNERLVDLNSVSDGICDNNSKKYVDFDKFIAKLHTKKFLMAILLLLVILFYLILIKIT